MSIKAYKLIPIRDFEKSDLNKKEDKNCEETEKEEDTEKTKVKRTIRDIVSDNLANTEFAPSKHYVADIKFPQKGGGRNEMPIWLPNENQLPEFSKGYRIKKNYDEIDTILNNDELSDDLKVRLYSIFRKKYNNARKARNYEDDDDDDDDDDGTYGDDEGDGGRDGMRIRRRRASENMRTMRDIAADLPASKQRYGYRLVTIFMKNRKHLNWDMNGYIIKPYHRNIDLIENMKKLMEILVYKQRGSADQIIVAADLISPFSRQMDGFINNIKLSKELEKRRNKISLSKYVSWYK